MVQQTTPEFECEDGKTFPTKAEAEQHEKLATTREDYERARRKYARALWETQKTADGYPFKMVALETFYYLANWAGEPKIREVSFYCRNMDLDDSDRAVIHDTSSEEKRRGPASYRIGELYVRKANAEAALLKELEEYVARLQQSIADRKAAAEGN